MNRWIVAAALTAACAKGPAPSGKHAWLIVESPTRSGIDLAAARVEGRGILYAAVQGSRLVVEVDPERTSDHLSVSAGGACPVTVDRGELGDGKTARRTLEPLFDFGPEQAQAGFDTRFEMTAEPRCPTAESLRLAWRVKSGTPLHDMVVSAGGRRFGAKTERFVEALGPSTPWGVVPISPRTRAETLVEASWTNADGSQGARTVRVSAAARARGLPNVTVGTRLYLGGEGFHVVAAPTGAHAGVEMNDGHASLVPDARGKWTLADGKGRLLRLVAGKYDETPLDCGRSDCHAATTEIAKTSPMASILERGLDSHFASDYPACALACHAVGEPGTDDGGFASVLGELGRTPQDLARTGYHELPTSLRRLGGVGCLACHGAGAIPEESARFSILRADVCATCHDAPPRYGHVAAWRASRMARADADARASAQECARCHTTWGFLNDAKRRPPEGTEPLGIGCAACHAAHPPSADRAYSAGTCADKLLRDVPVPPLFEKTIDPRTERSRICLGCHSPREDDATPTATAAAVWAGRGGIDPKSGTALVASAPHAAVANGCIGCHHAGPPNLERGASHAFQVARDSCQQCHAPGRRDPQIRARAEALWSRFAVDTKRAERASEVHHARGLRLDRSKPHGRALWNIALVLEDPAADAHNGPYARRLLDAAESALGGATSVPRAPGSAVP